jgi:hypothetical protein
MVKSVVTVGVKARRWCPVKADEVDCDGLCKVVFAGDGVSPVYCCPVYVEKFDEVVNG